MASGKDTPRQKMINLMYLIFIAMLALNMSKEVLAAFGIMNEKLEASNEKMVDSNDNYLANLDIKANEDPAKYADLYKNAQRIKEMSAEYYTYLAGLKSEMMKGTEDPKDYAVMDTPDYLDQKFFQGDNLAEGGKEFMKRINDYRKNVAAIVPAGIKESVNARFKTGDDKGKVVKRDGSKQDWINYHYEGFPQVASLAKLTALQADVKSTEESALIAADKMNVVYRGVANPMSISIPGIPDNKVSASAPGLKKVSASKYVMNPGTGRTVKIVASGTLPDGQRISTPAEFRIKDIPRPAGTVSKQDGSVKLPRGNLEIATIGAMLEDFDFDLNLAVSGFKFKVPGQPTVSVNGNKLNGMAKTALKRAKRGDVVQIFDVEAYITNNKTYRLKKVSPVIVELTN